MMPTEALIGLAALIVTVCGYCVWAIYQAGRLSVRVEYLERGAEQLRADVNAIHGTLRRVEGLIRGEEV